MKKQSAEGHLDHRGFKQSVAPLNGQKIRVKITLVEEDLRPYFPENAPLPDVKKGIFEALALRQKLQERSRGHGGTRPASKEAAKPS